MIEPFASVGDTSQIWALFAVFVTCVIAGSIIPVSSEVVVAGAAIGGLPVVPLVVVATIGNVVGACLNYATGRLGVGWWRRWRASRSERTGVVRQSEEVREHESRASRWVRRWGAPSLALSWLPIIGDPLTFVAGALGVAFTPFLGWVTVGKAVRYIVVVGATDSIAKSFGW